MNKKDKQFTESIPGLTRRLKEAALRSGFLLAGSCRAVAAPVGILGTRAGTHTEKWLEGENGGESERNGANEQRIPTRPELAVATDLRTERRPTEGARIDSPMRRTEDRQSDSDASSAVRDHLRTLQRFETWLKSGEGASMRYLSDRWDAYHDPASVLPGVRSFLVLAAGYRTVRPAPLTPGTARIATYAWGDDYHHVLRRRLRSLVQLHREIAPQYAVRGCVDTEPLFEKELARRAGLGWIGKHTLLTHPVHGTRLLLAVLLTSAVLEYDEPKFDEKPESDNEPKFDDEPKKWGESAFATVAQWPCRDCDACVRACPTGALRPYRLDARRCRSYLTIESREPIPAELSVGEQLFGCERCQEVCPWNRAQDALRPDDAAKISSVRHAFLPRDGMNPVALSDILAMDEAEYRTQFGGMAVERAGRERLQQTAARILAAARDANLSEIPPTPRKTPPFADRCGPHQESLRIASGPAPLGTAPAPVRTVSTDRRPHGSGEMVPRNDGYSPQNGGPIGRANSPEMEAAEPSGEPSR